MMYVYTRGGTVQLFHGSVCITVLESRFGMFRGKPYCQIKIICLTTSNSTNKYNRVKIQIQ